MLNITIKKGNPHQLHGKLIAYVTIEDSPEGTDSHMDNMIQNGILAVKANYIDQRNIRDFFEIEFGKSLEKGIEDIIDQAKDSGGLESALDPEVVREKLESMRNMEFIPIPAKIAHFQSEEQILEEDADIYYLGHFKIVSHAHLCVNSFPILYQANFREHEQQMVQKEIESMLGDFTENQPLSTKNKRLLKGSLKSHLLKELVPEMIYNLKDKTEYAKSEKLFIDFMSDFGYEEDTKEIIQLIQSDIKVSTYKLEKIELIVDKIEALQNEDYKQLEVIQKKIAHLDTLK